MGLESPCVLRVGGRSHRGKALLETDAILFRGDFSLKIPLASIRSVRVAEGTLRIVAKEVTAEFELGDQAQRWAQRIRNPPTLWDKLGLKAGQRLLLAGAVDADFRHGLAQRSIVVARPRGQDVVDAAFFFPEAAHELTALRLLTPRIGITGALWVVYPKGRSEIREAQVLEAGRQAGWVDVKVVRFSQTRTALRFVVPKARR